MLDSTNTRQLAYLVRVDSVSPMDADRLECAHVGGWNCVVGKGEFKAGDIAVYFEIDSKLPEKEPFTSMEFLASKKFKIKSQKIRGVVSQGLLMPISAFGWTEMPSNQIVYDPNKEDIVFWHLNDDSRFLTKELGVTYAVLEDNARKGSGADKYKKMAQRHPKLARTKVWRWLMRHKWGKKLLFFFFGRKRDKKSSWPAWVVKTDEERVQNIDYNWLKQEPYWIATEKIDGTSTTFTLRRNGRKREFYVCSRNVVFDKPNKKCFYDTNVYTEMAEKYHIEEKMNEWLDHFSKNKVVFVTIQGETYGDGIQKRNYSLLKDRHELAIFNMIVGYKDGTTKRLNPIEGCATARRLDLPYVPVFGVVQLPPTCADLLEMASGASQIDGLPREGLVFRSEDGTKSFKAVSNEYLLKYHG